MNKLCPRCNSPFDCRHDDIAHCHCAGVSLDARQLAFIKQNYADCLCNSCLQTVKDCFYATSINPAYGKNRNG